jgi:hypothetical protein
MAMLVPALLLVVLCVAVGTGSNKKHVMLQYHFSLCVYVYTSAITQAPLSAEQILLCTPLQALRVSTPP